MIELADCEAHLWWTSPESVRDPELLLRQLRALSPEEREQHQRFVFERHRHQYLVSHALVRDVLSRYAPVPPAEWRFAVNSYGRPSIAHPEEFRGLEFNLSHTEGRTVVAIARDGEIGVDVESAVRRGDLTGIADRFFAPPEIAQLPLRPDAFFDFWTLKEAYIKARGMGLSIPLDSFWFDLTGPEPRIAFLDGGAQSPERWQFRQYRDGEYRAALAASFRGDGKLRVVEREVVPLDLL